MTTDNKGVPTAEEYLKQTAMYSTFDNFQIVAIEEYLKELSKLHLEAQREAILNNVECYIGFNDKPFVSQGSINQAYNIEENVK